MWYYYGNQIIYREKDQMITEKAVEKMIDFYDGSLHDINHFLKVLSFARTIGTLEQLDEETQQILELAAVVHDIACPVCREKYGNADGAYQEAEGPEMAAEFYREMGLPEGQTERICYLVGHHHTCTDVDGMDYQILLEADFLVNADEAGETPEEIKAYRDRVFKTKTGSLLLNSIYKI